MKCLFYWVTIALACCTASVSTFAATPEETPLPGGRVLDGKHHKLVPAPDKQAASTAADRDGDHWETQFQAQPNSGEVVLAVGQKSVNGRWDLVVNGRRVCALKPWGTERIYYYAIPPGTLKAGTNTVAVKPDREREKIAIGPVVLYEKPLRELLQLEPVFFTVSDATTGRALPARVTITDTKDQRVDLYYSTTNAPLREGLLYTLGNETQCELPPGDYFIYATRGMEWGRDKQRITVAKDQPARVKLSLTREVDTTGFIAADTHVHTLTFSFHGDASIDERMVTLAGEGVELAISTDHNHHTDYRPYQEKMGASNFFTPVTGNEVTTPVGHMNAFPMQPKDEPPVFRLKDWVALVDGIRAKGAQVVILNHPRWPTIPTSPFTSFGLNRASGDFTNHTRFPFDGMELANALAPQPDPLYVFHDWFALLNHGERITGVAASDSHSVEEPVGQGRSFVPSRTDDPLQIDVADACGHFKRGETSISVGIFADARVDEKYTMGQTNSSKDPNVNVKLRVASASWIKPRRAIVYLNGQQVAEKPVPTIDSKPTDTWIDFSIPRPSHDAYLVCVVLGDGATNPSWHTKENFTLAATNPVFLDADDDGQYSNPREIARRLIEKSGDSLDTQMAALKKADDPIAVEMASLLCQRTAPAQRADLDKRLRETAQGRPLLEEFVKSEFPVIQVDASQIGR